MRNVRIEQILSSARPEPAVYDQGYDEWVLLVHGHAELDVAGEHVVLEQGDWLLIPAGTRHQVLKTTDGTSWLALHVR